MKVSIFTSRGTLVHEVDTLTKELMKRGAEVNVVQPHFSVDEAVGPNFGANFLNCDVLYYRAGLGVAGKYLLGRMTDKNIYSVNKNVLQNVLLGHKLYQAVLVSRAGVKVPQTLLYTTNQKYQEIEKILGSDFIIKAAIGMQGKQVFLVRSEKEYCEALKHLSGDILLQQFIPNDGDFRVFVLDGEIIGIYKRNPKSGMFKSNIAQGGTGQAVTDTALIKKLSEIGQKVSSELSLDIVGVDIMMGADDNELYFIEANENPGWRGAEKALNKNISAAVAEWMVGKNKKFIL